MQPRRGGHHGSKVHSREYGRHDDLATGRLAGHHGRREADGTAAAATTARNLGADMLLLCRRPTRVGESDTWLVDG